MTRKIFTLTGLLIIQIGQSFSLFAQSSMVLDTLGWSSFQQETEALYASPNGGYVFGNNGYGDRVKARIFNADSCGGINSVLFKFGAKINNSGNPESRLIVRLYEVGAPGLTAAGMVDNAAPSSELVYVDSSSMLNAYTKFIYMPDIDTSGGLTSVDIDDFLVTHNCVSNFAIGLDFSDLLPGDTVGLVSNTDGEADQTETAWDLTASGDWVSVLHNDLGWGLDAVPAMFPVFTVVPVGVQEIEPNLGLSLYPNPGNTHVNFYIPHTGSLTIRSVSGELLFQEEYEFGMNTTIDISRFSPGLAVVKLVTPKKVFYAKLQVVH